MMGGYIVLIMLYPSTLHMHKMVDQFDIVSWIAKCEPLQKTYTHHSDKSEVDMILESMESYLTKFRDNGKPCASNIIIMLYFTSCYNSSKEADHLKLVVQNQPNSRLNKKDRVWRYSSTTKYQWDSDVHSTGRVFSNASNPTTGAAVTGTKISLQQISLSSSDCCNGI